MLMRKGKIANGMQRLFIFGCVASLMAGLVFTGGKNSVAEEIDGKTEICTLKSVKLIVPTDQNATPVTITGGLEPIIVDKDAEWDVYFGNRTLGDISFIEDDACTAKGKENHSFVAGYIFVASKNDTTWGNMWTVNRQETEDGYWYEWMCTTPYRSDNYNYVSSDDLKLDNSVGYYDVKFEPRFGMTHETAPTGIYVRFAKQYDITYDVAGGTVTGAQEVYTAGTEYTLPVPTKDGYIFEGWTGTGLTEPTKNVVISKDATGDRSYKANWVKTLPDVGEKQKDVSGKATYKVTETEDGDVEVTYVKPSSKKKTVTIPATVTLADGTKAEVTAVDAKAFKGDTKLQTITIGKNVETIGKEAFKGCKNLKKIKGSKNVEKIGKNAFANCTKLSSAAIGDDVESIGEKAFYKCSALKKITIPEDVKYIGKSAFQGCKKLKTIKIETKKLTKKNVKKNAFKGIPSNAKINVPNSKVKAYKSMLRARGVGKKASIK